MDSLVAATPIASLTASIAATAAAIASLVVGLKENRLRFEFGRVEKF